MSTVLLLLAVISVLIGRTSNQLAVKVGGDKENPESFVLSQTILGNASTETVTIEYQEVRQNFC